MTAAWTASFVITSLRCLLLSGAGSHCVCGFQFVSGRLESIRQDATTTVRTSWIDGSMTFVLHALTAPTISNPTDLVKLSMVDTSIGIRHANHVSWASNVRYKKRVDCKCGTRQRRIIREDCANLKIRQNEKTPALTRLQRPAPAALLLCFVTLNLTQKTQQNRIPRLMVEHFCVKVGDPSCSGFWVIVRNNRQTDKQTAIAEKPNAATTVDVGNY